MSTAKYKTIWSGALQSKPVMTDDGSYDTHLYAIEIRRYSDLLVTARELTFDAEEPVVIEWEACPPEEAIQGSRCTLKVESPDDRAFVDLFDYGVDTGPIQLIIRRDGRVWWRGVLDTDLYEEPYESLRGYITTLTFTDFGSMGRIPYDRTDADGTMDSAARILAQALGTSGLYTPEEIAASEDLTHGGVPSAWLHTYAGITPEGETEPRNLTLRDLCCSSANFIDEEGEPCTMRDALEALLRPAGLRMTQRCGHPCISDLDYLAEDAAHGYTRQIRWTGDHQTLSTGSTYNNITVRFSPYLLEELTFDELKLDDENYGIVERVIRSGNTISTGAGSTHPATLAHYDSFRIRVSGGCSQGLQSIEDPEVLYFETEPIMGSASEERGVTIRPSVLRPLTMATAPKVAMKTEPLWLPPKISGDRARLRVSVDLCIDSRINFFEDGTDDELNNYTNDEESYEIQKQNLGWLFVPCRLVVRDESGRITAYYDNSGCASRLVYVEENFAGAALLDQGSWVVPETRPADAPLVGRCWLEWYADSIDSDTPAIDGFTANRPTIGRFPGIKKIPQGLATRRGSGMNVPYPPVSGTLELTVYAECMGYNHMSMIKMLTWDGPTQGTPFMQYTDGGETLRERRVWADTGFAGRIKWFMMKQPRIEVVDNRTGEAFRSHDISYEAQLMPSAKDDLTVDTTVGTMQDPTSAARGLWRASDGKPVVSLTRNGVTTRPENMLIGTLYSQYRKRRCTLSGEALTTPGEEMAVTDAASEGRVFRIESERADLRSGTSEISAVELFREIYIEKIKTTES